MGGACARLLHAESRWASAALAGVGPHVCAPSLCRPSSQCTWFPGHLVCGNLCLEGVVSCCQGCRNTLWQPPDARGAGAEDPQCPISTTKGNHGTGAPLLGRPEAGCNPRVIVGGRGCSSPVGRPVGLVIKDISKPLKRSGQWEPMTAVCPSLLLQTELPVLTLGLVDKGGRDPLCTAGWTQGTLCELRGKPGFRADWVNVWDASTTVSLLTARLGPSYGNSLRFSWTWPATQNRYRRFPLRQPGGHS